MLDSVLFSSEHVGEFEAVTHEVTELVDFRGMYKTGFYHITHEKVTDPFGILVASLIPFLGLGIFGMCQGNKTGFFKDVEDRDPVLADRFHADFEEYLANQLYSSLRSLEKEEKRTCLYSVRLLASVMPMHA